MTRDVPYCDVDKHDESRPYYNVPVNADETADKKVTERSTGAKALWMRTLNFKRT